MQLSSETETANRFNLISRMADDLAHEIKNPLNSMVINLEVLRSRARKNDTDGVLGRADVLEAEVRRLNNLVEGLLRLLRPDRVAGGEIPVDILLAEIGELVGLQAKLARKELSIAFIGETAVTTGRRDSLRFALLNLLCAELDSANGSDARVDVTGTTGEKAVTITIASHGTADAGDPQRDMAVEIASALVAGMGGTVEVHNAPPDATERVISVTLPASRPA